MLLHFVGVCFVSPSLFVLLFLFGLWAVKLARRLLWCVWGNWVWLTPAMTCNMTVSPMRIAKLEEVV